MITSREKRSGFDEYALHTHVRILSFVWIAIFFFNVAFIVHGISLRFSHFVCTIHVFEKPRVPYCLRRFLHLRLLAFQCARFCEGLYF